ncbi:MAG TPA: radical SAM protein, partial [Clostridia bacterium]|nr:radical SAM protein [Clostridia bacterium]
LAGIDKLCRHFHISLQSGSDAVLRRMGRHYTTEEYMREIELLWFYMPDCAITTDIIVGFPSETVEEFETTCRFVEKIGFSRIHIFPYSARPDTPAAKWEDIGKQEKDRRVKALSVIADKTYSEFIKRFVGTTQKVLVERTQQDKSYGLTDSYIEVELNSKPIGALVDVLIEKADKILYGKAV